MVTYMETISAKSSMECVGKSPNNLNRVTFTAQPLSEELVAAFDKGTVPTEEKARANVLKDYGWDPSTCFLTIYISHAPLTCVSAAEGRRIWTVADTCVLVDSTKSVQNLREIKDKVLKSFIAHSAHGVLCGEELRGVRVDITDALVHQDNAHRCAST